jgi:hypothetical protein
MTTFLMTMWNAILGTGVAAIWLAMVSAVAYRVRAATVRARGLEPPRAARPNGT